MERYNDAVEFRQNGQQIFFAKCQYGTVIGKTHGGNFIVQTEKGDVKVVDSYSFEVVE